LLLLHKHNPLDCVSEILKNLEEQTERMESLIKQMRVRFSDLGQEGLDGATSARERRLPPQKTQSFKGVRRTPNWLERQFSGRIFQDNDLNDSSEYATVIAAAAFAVKSLEEQNQNKTTDDTVNGLTKSRTRKDNSNIGLPDPGRISRRFSGKEAKEDKQTREEVSIRKSEGVDNKILKSVPIGQNLPEKSAMATPTIRKTPTFSNVHQEGTSGTKHGTTFDKKPTMNRSSSTTNIEERILNEPTAPGNETKANAWEKAELEKIQKRYDRTNSTIISWENERKTKAKRRIEKVESELKGRKTRSTQRYNNDISRIDQIAGGARAVADQRRRKEETKVKEKAKKIRSSGTVPATCFCC
ncbi:hypothetical protein GIB67_007250, partial [Kingdonia uniflora]